MKRIPSVCELDVVYGVDLSHKPDQSGYALYLDGELIFATDSYVEFEEFCKENNFKVGYEDSDI